MVGTARPLKCRTQEKKEEWEQICKEKEQKRQGKKEPELL
jgi:hypothetical protein